MDPEALRAMYARMEARRAMLASMEAEKAMLAAELGVTPAQISMLARLPHHLVHEFLDAGCADPEADLLVDILEDAEAGLINEADAKDRVDDFVSTQRTKATWVASVGWGGGIAIAGADIIQMASEAANTVLAHPAIVAAMDMLAGGVATAALGAGIIFSRRLGRLPSRQNVLRRCARSLVRGVNQ
jgi:hypothetical protein